MSDIISDQEDARLLKKIQSAREGIIDQLLQNGKVPASKEDREFLNQTLNATATTILGKAKIKSDQTAAQSQAATAKAIAEALRRFKPGSAQGEPELPELSMDGFKTNPGETEIGAIPVTYKEVMGS